MNRRKFLTSCSVAVPGAIIYNSIGSKILNYKNVSHIPKNYDDDYNKKLADTSIITAKKLGASYSDFRLTNFRNQFISTRETNVQSISDNEDFGFSIRVIIDGTWGFASSSTYNETEVSRITALACEISKANRNIQKNHVELVPVPAYKDFWKTPIKKNPF
ncbi:MAG: PmbA/TldA family metallopeptidase, partial [Ignavibacteria bacterium]